MVAQKGTDFVFRFPDYALGIDGKPGFAFRRQDVVMMQVSMKYHWLSHGGDQL